MTATAYQTRFGSLKSYEKGHVEPIADDVKHYAMSNCFDIANRSKPYENVLVGSPGQGLGCMLQFRISVARDLIGDRLINACWFYGYECH